MGNPIKKHPHTGKQIRPLWIRPDGRVMWPILGASPDDPGAPPADPPGDPAPSDPPAGDPKPDEGKGGKDAILADLAKERDKRQELEQTVGEMQTAQKRQLDAFAKALGLKTDDDAPPDPAQLAEQISAEQNKTTAAEARATAAERQLAVFKLAGQYQGNPLALADSKSFLDAISEIDPTDAAALGQAIEQAVDANPLFKATPATPPFPGGPRPPAPPARAGTLAEAVAARLSSTNR